MTTIYVLIFFVLSFFIYNLISYLNVLNKRKSFITSYDIYNSASKINFFNSYINGIESKLFNLGFPYKLSTKKYLIIKYVLSLIIGIIAIINYKSIKALIIFYLVTFFTPDYLIYNYKNKEKYILINEIKNLTQNIILNLSAYSTLEQALVNSKGVIEYKRFKNAYEQFIYEYKTSGYNLKASAFKFESKFLSYELSLFLTTLIQGDKEGNLLENIKKFSDTLELNYFKYLKKKSSERLMYVTLGTVLSLLNIVLVVMYPMFSQVLNNLQIMFS